MEEPDPNAIAPEDGRAPSARRRLPARIVDVLARSEAARFGVLTALAIAFVAGVASYGATRLASRAVDERGSNEALSLGEHSSTVATGDVYRAYLQLGDFAARIMSEPPSLDRRRAVLSDLVSAQTSRFRAAAVVDANGHVVITTSPELSGDQPSDAIAGTRWYLGPANSDIIVSGEGQAAYVDFATPLRAPDGTMAGTLLARAAPAQLWRDTFALSIDGSRNVLLNSQGQYAGGLPDAFIGTPWTGQALANERVRARVAGVESICGIAPVGAETRIDHGWHVASCLPESVLQRERSAAWSHQWLVASAAALLAWMAALLGYTLLRRAPQAAALRSAAPSEPDDIDDEHVATDAAIVVRGAAPTDLGAQTLTALEAAEYRNARLAERLRETLSARLLIIASEAREAFRMTDCHDETPAALHERAMGQLERVREQELRAIAHELHPAVVRMGLRAALMSLINTLTDVIRVSVEVEPHADLASRDGPGDDAASLDDAQRMVLYRFAIEASHGLARAGAAECRIRLSADDAAVSLEVGAELDAETSIDASIASEAQPAVELHGGEIQVTREGGVALVRASIPLSDVARHVRASDDFDSEREDAIESNRPSEPDDAEPEAA